MQFDLEITKYIPPGDGFGIHEGRAVFVPATAIGDVVRVYAVKEKKRFIIAVLKEVLTPAPDRLEAPCPHYTQCGGCSLMHLGYEKQIELKTEMLREILNNHGIEIAAEIVPPSKRTAFRHRTQVRCELGRIGFSERGDNRVVDVPGCLILSPGILAAFNRISKLGAAKSEYLLLESSDSGAVAAAVFNEKHSVPLPGFPSSVEEDYGFGAIELPVCEFAQSNPFTTGQIVADLVGACEGAKRICELYCGCGTFSIPVALKANEFLGYDISKNSIKAAKKNAARHHLDNTVFKSGNLEKASRLPKVETIIVDPPRKGLGKNIIGQIGRSKASKLVYISCNPSTLARDLKSLRDRHGFRISRITGYDMYCHSTHLEVFAVLIR